MPEPLLAVANLTVSFLTGSGWTPVVRDLSFNVDTGETLCLVGESGCGKSVTALSILRLLPRGIARIEKGSIRFAGRDLTSLDEEAVRAVRGNEIAMIFQEPMTSLNPVLTVGEQIAEALVRHERLSMLRAFARTRELLERVRIPDAERRLRAYPHQLSGGMRQRVMIAMALACRPKLIIADEPTTALDVTIQAQILALLAEIREELGTAVVLITHDLGVVAEIADRVIVLYAGEAAEEADVFSLFERPRHPYTHGLMRSLPRIARGLGATRLQEIRGTVPAPVDLPAGCAFAPRCDLASTHCRAEAPRLAAQGPGHRAACWHADGAAAEADREARP
jgi:peptide/nickel transport system ATP-binding protein